MSSRIFQSVIVQLKEATNRMIGVIDNEGFVVTCSDPSMVGEKMPEALIRLSSAPDAVVTVEGKTFKPLVTWIAYFITPCLRGEDERAHALHHGVRCTQRRKGRTIEKHDKGYLCQKHHTDNILPGRYLYPRKSFHFAAECSASYFGGQLDHAEIPHRRDSGDVPDKQQDFVSASTKRISSFKQVPLNAEEAIFYAIAETIESKCEPSCILRR